MLVSKLSKKASIIHALSSFTLYYPYIIAKKNNYHFHSLICFNVLISSIFHSSIRFFDKKYQKIIYENDKIWAKILIWHDKAQNNAHFLIAASWWSDVSLLLFLMALLKRFLWTFHRLFMIPIVMLNTGGLWLLRSDACFRLTGLSQHSGVWFGAKSLTKLHCAQTYVLYDTTM